MRKLIMWNVVTLDGYFEGEKNWDLSFHELVWGKELDDFSNEQLKSTIVKDAAVEIPKLKQQGNGDIFVFGSGKLSESLIKAELFDKYRLCIAPIFLGRGRLLFNQGIPHEKLQLLETRPLAKGGIILRYAPDREAKA